MTKSKMTAAAFALAGILALSSGSAQAHSHWALASASALQPER